MLATKPDHFVGALDLCVHQMFEKQSERIPESIAVAQNNEVLNYRDLNRRANQLAHHLRNLGIGPEVRVAVYLERTPQLIVALLATLKAGGAYVPLDPSYPMERLEYMLADSKAALLISETKLQGRFANASIRILCIDRESETISRESLENPVNISLPKSMAYVIYTSGSTGNPKGVMIEHWSLANFVQSITEVYGIRSTDRVLQFSSISFDAAAEEIYPTLCNGACLVLRTDSMMDSIATFLKRCGEWNITVLDVPTAVWHSLAESLAADHLAFPEKIRLVIIGGEKALGEKLAVWNQRVDKRVQLINTYGPTEVTIVATSISLVNIGSHSRAPFDPPIGKPIPNIAAYVLDEQLQPLPVGVPGELFLGGYGVARGYLNRSELTAEKFIPDPFGNTEGSRLYKTGDLVRVDPNGTFEFIGRVDHQVKIRGFRIELGEIESALMQHPDIRDTVVLCMEDSPDDKRLVGYLVSKTGSLPPLADLRMYLRKKLPAFMVPSAFVPLNALPLTPGGKLDRSALRAPEQNRPELEAPFVAPEDSLEKAISIIWCELLRTEQVGVTDNFFELGGHSLLATQLLSRMNEVFHAEIPMHQLFDAPSVRNLAVQVKNSTDPEKVMRIADLFLKVAQLSGEEVERMINQNQRLFPDERTSAPTLISVLSIQKRLLLKALIRQEGLETPGPSEIVPHRKATDTPASYMVWFTDQLDPGTAIYNIPEAIRLKGSLHLEAFRDSVQEVIRRHEALRSTVATVDGKPLQIIAPKLNLPIPLVELSNLPIQEREGQARRLIEQESMRPFDLAKGPLIRFLLLRMGAEEYVVLMTIHHIISDGWSIDLLFRELSEIYEAYSQGKPSPLPEPSIQYSDFISWHTDWMQGEVLASQLPYWKKQLQGLQPMDLPIDRLRPSKQTFEGATKPFQLPAHLNEQLRELCKNEGVTLFMLLLAAFKVLLYRYTRQTDLAVGSPVAARTRMEMEGIIGCLTNVLVLRTDLSGDPSFRELLARIRRMSLDAFANQNLDFEKLVEELHPQRSLNRPPFFEVMFVLQNTPVHSFRGMECSNYEVDKGTSMFDLTLEMEDTGKELKGFFEYNNHLFYEGTLDRMRSHFLNLLEAIVSSPEKRISEIPVMSQTDRHQVLAGWNDTSRSFPKDRCLHQLFEARVYQAQNAIALKSGQQTITYQELNSRANRLANYLKRKGVGPDVLVGIVQERSVDFVVSMLGVLKAGGAYLPIEPSLPQDQIEYLLKDSRCGLLLTQEEFVKLIPSTDVQTICLKKDWRTIALEGDENPVSGVLPENLAYIIYTSGSTGRPKGVLVPHRSLVNHCSAVSDEYAISSHDRILQFAPLNFDVAVEELFPSLLSGATVVLRTMEILTSFQAFDEFLRRESITILNLPATFWHEWVLALSESGGKLPSHLRLVIAGSEHVLPSRYLVWQEISGGRVEWRSAYGPTEASVTASIYRPQGSTSYVDLFSMPIGHPIANTKFYVLDNSLEPVPPGVSGELYIGGEPVVRGYLNMPEMTAASFLPDPFCGKPGKRMYQTGDVGRHLADGNIVLLRRSDQQVKIRGYRIELGEIEAVLSEHSALRDVVVTAQEDASGDKRLVAHLISQGNSVPSVSDLRIFLKKRLPSHMIPSYFQFLDALPLTATGKVDREALPSIGSARPDLDLDFQDARNPLEKVLSLIWSDVLGVENVGVHDNFFDLGGHSLLATQLISRLRSSFQLELPLRNIFEAPTIGELAEMMTADEKNRETIEKTAQVLLSLSQLSEEEAEKMLVENSELPGESD